MLAGEGRSRLSERFVSRTTSTHTDRRNCAKICDIMRSFFCVTILLASTIATCQPTAGASSSDRLTIASRILGESRAVLVHVPLAYANRAERFPVLYITDAEAQFSHT